MTTCAHWRLVSGQAVADNIAVVGNYVAWRGRRPSPDQVAGQLSTYADRMGETHNLTLKIRGLSRTIE